MKRIPALLLTLLFCGNCFPQVIQSFNHPSGTGISAPSARLLKNGYLVASAYNDGVQSFNYISRYNPNGTVSWTKTEQTGLFSGIMDMAENSRQELYFLLEDVGQDQYYGLIKTDSAGQVLWSVNLGKKGYVTYESPKLCVNNANEVYVMSSTYEKTNLCKLDDNGNLLWTKTIEVDSVSTKNPAFDIISTQDGGIIYSGKAGTDIYMQRLASNGTVLWTKRLFESLSYSHPKAIVELQDGHFLVTGFRGKDSNGLFLLKMDGDGMVQDYKFYYDSTAVYAFIPYAICETPNGHIRVMGGGGMASFADFDANLNLERYSVWTSVSNLLVSAGGFDYHNNQLLITGTDENNTTQYVLRSTVQAGDFCNQQNITTIVTQDLPIDNALYVTTAAETSGPGISPAAYLLVNATPFVTSLVCGQLETTTTGMEENIQENSINVYPNPVSAGQPLQLNISWDEPTLATLVDASGKVVLQQNVQGQQQLNTGTLTAGLYFLSLSVNEKTPFTTKIIVY